jgi:hypothetical protein
MAARCRRPDRAGGPDDLPDASDRRDAGVPRELDRLPGDDLPGLCSIAREATSCSPATVSSIRRSSTGRSERRHVHASPRGGGRRGRPRRSRRRLSPPPDPHRGRLVGCAPRRRDAAEEHVLLPEAHLRPAALSA